jgi:hypothetical protein
MSKAIMAVAITVPVIVIAYLAVPLVIDFLNPCREISHQTVTKVHANLDLISTKGGVWLETSQIQYLSDRSERMAMALKTCCIAHHHHNLSADSYLRCQSNLKDYDQQVERVVTLLGEAQDAAQRQESVVVKEKVEQAKTMIAAAAQSADTVEKDVQEVVRAVPAPPVSPAMPKPAPAAALLGWRDPHPAGYNDTFHHATVIDPRKAVTERIERQGDRDYFALHTGSARGTLRVRFEQTGQTAINPHLEFLYGSEVRSTWQRQAGTDLTADFKLDGKSAVAYIGVWDEGDDVFSDTPYRLMLTYEGDGELPDLPSAAMPMRFTISQVNRPEVEPNDDHFRATNVAPGDYVAGRIGTKGDVDFFKIDLGGQTTGALTVTLQHVDDSSVKPKLIFYDGDRAEAQSYYHSVPGIDLTRQQRLDKRYSTYYVAVSDSAGDAESEVPYILHIELVK